MKCRQESYGTGFETHDHYALFFFLFFNYFILFFFAYGRSAKNVVRSITFYGFNTKPPRRSSYKIIRSRFPLHKLLVYSSHAPQEEFLLNPSGSQTRLLLTRWHRMRTERTLQLKRGALCFVFLLVSSRLCV